MKAIKNDFYGNNYTWWVGVVEDRANDPLKMGCVRVRIFGIHPFNPDGTPDKSSVKTEDLPISQVMLPVTGSKSLSLPREGDWVTGFFQDGQNAQMPVIIGCLQGIDNKNSIIDVPNSPQLPEGVVGRIDGEPSNHRISRGIVEGTIIHKSNNDRVSVCDITADTSKFIGAVKTAFGPAIEVIRNIISKLIASLSGDPGGTVRTFLNIAQGIKSTLERVNRVVDDMKEVQKTILDVVRQARSMVDYILNLPEKTLRFIRECAAGILASIGVVIDSTINMTGVTEIIGDLNVAAGIVSESVIQIAGGVVDLTSTPIKMLDTFLSPTAQTDVNKANDTLTSIFSNQKTIEDVISSPGRLGP